MDGNLVRILIELRKLEGRLVRTFLYYIFRFFKINSKKIVFCVFRGNGYGDNPKYIAEEIIRKNLDYELVWLLSKEHMKNHNLPAMVRPVRFDSLRGIYELVTAKVWVDNHFKPPYVRKRKSQYYIHTSHGLPCLKRLEFEDFAELSKIEATKIDLFLSNGSWTSCLIQNDLWFKGEILECGNPRNDIFFDTDASLSDRVRERYHISPDQKVMLYAPTWRPHYDLRSYIFNIDMCLEALGKRFSGEWTVMVRHHPAVHDRSIGMSGSAHIIDASRHEDMQELLHVVDVVVTDYSSLMFDFAIRRLPIFLYTPDVDAYRKERGFYFDEHELPFSFAKSNTQLAKVIAEFDESLYVEQVDEFFSSIGTCDKGNASRAVVNRINETCGIQGQITNRPLHSGPSSPNTQHSTK